VRRRSRARLLLIAACAVPPLLVGATLPATAAPPLVRSYRVQAIPGLPSGATATGVNDAGTVVGTTTNGLGFVWNARTKRSRSLGTLSCGGASPSAISDRGFVAGSGNVRVAGGGCETRAVRWAPGASRPRDLGTLGGSYSVAYDVNDSGVVVGVSATASGDTHAFRWDPRTGRMRDLGTLGGPSSTARAINDAGTIVGAAGGEGSDHAVLWRAGSSTIVDLGYPAGWIAASASDINDRGDIVGIAYSAADETERVFRSTRRDRTLRLLPGLKKDPVFQVATNDRGDVVGTYSREPRAFLWRAATGPLDLPGADGGASAVDINNAGTVIGKAGDNWAVRWVRR
jgi:probable HAF family extracellular repeat protein